MPLVRGSLGAAPSPASPPHPHPSTPPHHTHTPPPTPAGDPSEHALQRLAATVCEELAGLSARVAAHVEAGRLLAADIGGQVWGIVTEWVQTVQVRRGGGGRGGGEGVRVDLGVVEGRVRGWGRE